MKKIIQKLGTVFFGSLLICSALLLISSQNKSVQPVKFIPKALKGIVVMELFTSQGCSSCPPADALLAEYASAHNEHIIALSFHVDYWNRLGWADPFSSKMYSERQQWYSQHLPKGSVYTPQLILNGKGEAVGNDRKKVSGLLQAELANERVETIMVKDLTIDKNAISFHYDAANTNKNEVLNIALVQKQATTHIKAGENEGVTITNHNIVRSFATQAISNEGSGSLNIPPMFKASEYALVLYIQNKSDLSISTATMKDL